jgi:hypothetical protein
MPDTVIVRESQGNPNDVSVNSFIQTTVVQASQTKEFSNLFELNDSEDFLFSPYTSKLAVVGLGTDDYLGKFKEMMDEFQKSSQMNQQRLREATQDKTHVRQASFLPVLFSPCSYSTVVSPL